MRNSTSHRSAGFVLHSYPYMETSLIVETFTRSHGRVAMVAKGAKRAGGHKFALHAFQPLTIDWLGRTELKTMKCAEHEQIYPRLRGAALMAAFYVNELLLKLATKEDAHELLFDAYADTIGTLAKAAKADGTGEGREMEVVLRRFELTLLAELGYALTLTHEADSDAGIHADLDYFYVVERGPIRSAGPVGHRPAHFSDTLCISGRTLRALADGLPSNHPDTADARVRSQAKQLMRRVINHHLGDKTLHTRQLARELK